MVGVLLAAVTAFVPVLTPGDAVPATRLIDQTGRPFTFPDLHGKTLVVSFGYTRCRDGDACPLVAAKLARLQALVRREAIFIVELTVDPAHDDPASLHRYANVFAADPGRWRFATGAPLEVRELDERLGASILPAAADGQIPHTETVVIVDAHGRVADRLGGDDWTPADLAERARAVAGRPANVFEQARLALARGIEAACGGGKSGLTLGAGILIFLALTGAIGYAMARAFGLQSPKIAAQSTIQSASAPPK